MATYGFIIMDGSDTIFGMIKGDEKHIIGRRSVDLPKKLINGKLSDRFKRIRLEKINVYIKDITRLAIEYFVNVDGIILGAWPILKKGLSDAIFSEPKLKDKILLVVDINYGGEYGFDQAIKLFKDSYLHPIPFQ